MTDTPEPISTELSRLLADWAVTQRLSAAEVARLRANVLAADADTSLDFDWLWNLMRPVTALLDAAEYSGRAVRQWPFAGEGDRPYTPYLQLA
jgi:hypothetical protein